MAERFEESFCGCCGGRTYKEKTWCSRCLSDKPHLGPPGLPPWERTWFAIYGTDCPFQEVAQP